MENGGEETTPESREEEEEDETLAERPVEKDIHLHYI
jgi:hypothetical protein